MEFVLFYQIWILQRLPPGSAKHYGNYYGNTNETTVVTPPGAAMVTPLELL